MRTEGKTDKKKLLIAVGLAVLCIAAIVCAKHFGSGGGQITEEFSQRADGQIRSVAYDPENGILYAGTHEGSLYAFKDGDLLWRTDGSQGSQVSIVPGSSGETVYTGTEGQHVLAYRVSDGSVIFDVATQRLVVDIAVNSDESRIAAVTNTGKNKSNLIIYDNSGAELFNTPFKPVTFRGIEYTSDDSTLITANKKGVAAQMSEEGESGKQIETGYDIMDMSRNGENIVLVSKDASVNVISEEPKILRTVKLDNSLRATMSTVAMTSEGDVFIGTEQGFAYVLRTDGEQVDLGQFSSKITDAVSVGEDVIFGLLDGGITVLHTANLDGSGSGVWVFRGLLAAGILLALGALWMGISAVPVLDEKARRIGRQIWNNRMAYLFLLPVFVLLYFFAYRGIVIAITRAFTNWSKTNYHLADIKFIGLENFRNLTVDPYFQTGTKNLLIIIVVQIIKAVSMPLFVAWLIYSLKSDRSKYLHRFLFVFPCVIPGVINIMIWKRIYEPQTGLLNNLLIALGAPGLQRVWLGDPKTALAAILFSNFPFVMALPLLIYYGGLNNISQDVIESATIDGAGRSKIFWGIQLPLIKPQIALVVTLQFIISMQDYYTIYIMTSGGPGTATYVPSLELYYNVAQFGRYGYASAMGVVLLIATIVVLIISNLFRRKEG